VTAPRSVALQLARSWSVELLALAATAAVVVLLRAGGLRMGWQAIEFTLPPMVATLPKLLLSGVVIQVVLALAARRSVGGYLRAFFQPASLWSWLRICGAFMLVTFAYSWLKVCVPLLRHDLYDGPLWRLDRALHLGFSPNLFAVTLASGTRLTGLVDRWYAFWLVTVYLAWAWAAAHPDLGERRRFIFACALLSIAGSWIYLALPALGPCYANREVFEEVAPETPMAVGTEAALAANYAKMIAGRDGSLARFNPYLGVAAMPSLHVGAHWLFALWARRRRRRWFLPLAAMTGVTLFASLVTGWHYAVDGYAGMLLAWGAIALADRIDPPPVMTAPEPEPGGAG
jgi:PAP2 superfamily